MSLCGKERNFIAHADRLSPFTFKEKHGDVEEGGDSQYLLYAGTLKQPFCPELLAYHPETGRIYHEILEHKYYKGKYGLLHPHLCLELGESIVYEENTQRYVYKQHPLKLF